jgi:hypothetical protein
VYRRKLNKIDLPAMKTLHVEKKVKNRFASNENLSCREES